ncbi:MAG: methyltransferase domain-containing protein [Leptolyngbya sp. SIO4C1]|nr:methyltransferase domain-containing protein [Leptolyngbya sp. SIO4C1]
MTQDLYRRIGQFYDGSSRLWEEVWGEHMHHGYYGPTGRLRKDRYQAQIDLMDELLRWGKVETASQILDAGCGIGGSTLYLAKRFQAEAVGITLSPVQAQRAAERSQAASIPAKFKVANALDSPFADGTFDLVWSLESGEHMPDKRQFLRECYRQLQPGSTFLMATWCHRPTDSLAGPLTASEQRHLEAIYQVYCLPHVISLPDYRAIAAEVGFEQIQTADWSTAVAPFWDEVIRSALDPSVLVKLLGAGRSTIQGALSLGLMSSGYRRGLIRFGLMRGVRG